MTTAQRLALAGLTLDGADLRDESGALVGRVAVEVAGNGCTPVVVERLARSVMNAEEER